VISITFNLGICLFQGGYSWKKNLLLFFRVVNPDFLWAQLLKQIALLKFGFQVQMFEPKRLGYPLLYRLSYPG